MTSRRYGSVLENETCIIYRQSTIWGSVGNGFTGMSPFTSLELTSAIPNMYVYIKCIHEVCAGVDTQCRNYPQLGVCWKMIYAGISQPLVALLPTLLRQVCDKYATSMRQEQVQL